MKCVILCGGQGTRMGDLTQEMPKPLLKIGNKPMLCHLMDYYAKYGVTEFIVCLGYLGDKIKGYFAENPSKYSITFVDTGENTTKAERLLKIKDLLDEDFCVAYGDDLSDVNIKELVEFYNSKNKIAMLTAIRPQNPFGILELDEETSEIKDFKEKPLMNEWINGGYFIFNKKIFNYFGEGDELEKEIFEKLVKDKQIVAYKHRGFWKSMNNLKDYKDLNLMFESGKLK
ncbi:NTP transferase domain-containing protein [Candidatus Pacearchaeota archaeon]|nr:NTP transferase domain-containing protein [Candidatus Pacearchaeota archaeon]